MYDFVLPQNCNSTIRHATQSSFRRFSQSKINLEHCNDAICLLVAMGIFCFFPRTHFPLNHFIIYSPRLFFDLPASRKNYEPSRTAYMHKILLRNPKSALGANGNAQAYVLSASLDVICFPRRRGGVK